MRSLALLSALIPFLFLGQAQAQGVSPFAADEGAASAGGYPDEYTLRPLVLPDGGYQVWLPVMFNLSKDSVGKPVIIPPEFSIGLNSQLTFRLYTRDSIRIQKGAKVFNDLGVGFLYEFSRSGAWQFAALGAVEVNSFRDPAIASLRGGVSMKYIRSPYALVFEPQIRAVVVHRDAMSDQVDLPVEGAYQFDAATAFFVQTGLFLGDNYSVIPLGLGVNYLLQHGLDVGAMFKFPNALGDGSTVNARELWLYLRWRSF
jgi:hypothetical protein